jgi:predicted branched-subunit amino acid permease
LRDAFFCQPRWFRWFGPYLLVDAVAVLTSKRQAQGVTPRQLRHHYLATGLTVWVGWHMAVFAGAIAGPVLPAALHLELALPLLLVGLLAPSVRSYPALAAALVAGLAAVGAAGLPLGLALPAGAMAGAVAGRYLDHGEAGR